MNDIVYIQENVITMDVIDASVGVTIEPVRQVLVTAGTFVGTTTAGGNMTKAVYDPNDDGSVKLADNLLDGAVVNCGIFQP